MKPKLYDCDGDEIFVLKHMLARLMEYFFTNDENMSNRENVYSAKYILYEYGSNPVRCSTELQEQLEKLLINYFDSVDVKIETSDETNYTVYINITVHKDGKSVTLKDELVNGVLSTLRHKIDEFKQYTQ